MKCKICKLGPMHGITVYRMNAVGEMPAVWACAMHRDKLLDPEVEHIVDTIEGTLKQ